MDAFTDFTVNRALSTDGYALLRNTIVPANASCGVTVECRRIRAYLAKWNYNGGHNGSIDPSLMRLNQGEEDTDVLTVERRENENGTRRRVHFVY